MKSFLFFALACTKTAEKNIDTATESVTAPWPDWALRHWVWEDESTQDSVFEMLDGYAENDIPVGAIIIDSPWATGYSTYQWDTERFPEPQAMIDEIHARDVRLMLWTVPMINIDVPELYEEANNAGYFLVDEDTNEAMVYEWWKGEGSLIDYYNPDAVAWWHELIRPILEMGIDGWKTDGAEFGVALQISYSMAAGRTVTRQEYSHLYYQDFFDFSRDVMGADRIITARPVDNYGANFGGDAVAFAPTEITWAGWVGDQDSDFEGLKMALRNMYWSAEYGYLSFGSDIGGYRHDDELPLGREKETFIRWAQMGAFSTVMENGGSGEHWPWRFDQETVDIYKRFTDLHYKLLPYFAAEGVQAIEDERSLYKFTHNDRYSYLLGDDIFVAPVLEENGAVTISFPTGEWMYLFDSSQVFDQSNQEMAFTVPLDEFPVFVRVGSAVSTTLLGE